jgi:hypothetical protein
LTEIIGIFGPMNKIPKNKHSYEKPSANREEYDLIINVNSKSISMDVIYYIMKKHWIDKTMNYMKLDYEVIIIIDGNFQYIIYIHHGIRIN